MYPLKELKLQQKKLAVEIRELKNHRPLSNRGDYDLCKLESDIMYNKHKFRHHHIAYCELRGRKREQIERPAKDNLPNKKFIETIKNEYTAKIEKWRLENENVCIS